MRVVFRSPLGEEIENPKKELLQELIVNPKTGYWDRGSGGTTIDCYADQTKTSLMMFPHRNYGTYLRFYDEENKPWLSVGDEKELSRVVECNDEWYVSVGLFVPNETAWLAVWDFCLAGGKSAKVKWITPSEIPEDGNW
jgi:hypothetical protein